MRYWVLRYDVVEGYIERRGQFRDEHLRLAREARDRGELILAGAVGDPPDGALIDVRASSSAIAEAFAHADPYVTNGLVTRWQVKPWAVVVGDVPAPAT